MARRVACCVRTVLLEAAVVACATAVLGLAANSLSPRGLVLGRDYFRIGTPVAPSAAASVPQPSNSIPVTNSIASADNPTNLAASHLSNAAAAKIRSAGFNVATLNDIKAAYESPQYRQSGILLIDARNDDHYLKGHIPGSIQLDYYRPEAHLPLVIPLAQLAEQVFVYCTGGTCEDSELAAMLLRDAGIPSAKIYVYLGGFAEWSGAGLPVEAGVRDSGQIMSGTAR